MIVELKLWITRDVGKNYLCAEWYDPYHYANDLGGSSTSGSRAISRESARSKLLAGARVAID